ncbi:cytochrome c oxidase subunit II [Halocatena salina]|uniref:cytochrome-c oxidase n=1 Tax=Halocatena salina TaxID=2934340 RepID=A0A8U0A3T8_9EURY|nr:cytochrome c oxidase subunit II [Halocatena salina]UPM43850.1 cytochrome c oxidase subunit II [Halocatena salina]
MTATRIRRAVGISVGLALATLFVAPAAAQPSINSKLITDLNNNLLYAAVPITVLVEVILIYTVYRFKDSGEAKPTQENRRLEITWTVATAIILLFVGLASTQVLASSYIGAPTADSPSTEGGNVEGLTYNNTSGAYAPTEDNAVQIEVVAYKYAWTFNYIDAEGDVTSTNTLVIPEDRPVYLHLVSQDWLHSFHAPDLGLKQDAFPGQYNTMKTKATDPGTYQLYCAEYCGVGHSQMTGTIEVKSQADYQSWLEQQQSSNESGNTTDGNASNQTATNNQTAPANESANTSARLA